jgi:hypothetical protein
MPPRLRFLAIFSFACFLFLPMAFVDNMFITRAQVMTLGELWRSGGGPALFLAGTLFPLSGFGFFDARGWSRFTYMTAILVLVAWSVLHSILGASLGIAWFVYSASYLFGDPAARAYFAQRHLTNR